MNQRPEDQNDQTEAIPQQSDDTTQIDAGDAARMPSAPDPSVAPPEVEESPAADAASPLRVGARVWAAVSASGPSGSVPAAASPAKTVVWKGRMALAGGALAAGLLLGGAVGATTAVAIGGTDEVTQVTEGGRGGFAGEGRPPGGRHGGGMGELPDGEGPLPGGGQGELPGGGTSTDPNDANTTDQTT